MSSQTGTLRITDCSRGLSDWYPARLDDDQLAEAWDVEFYDGTVCGRRNGCTARISTPAVQTGHSLFVHTPTTNRAQDRIFIAYSGEGAGLGAVHSWGQDWALPGIGFSSVPDTLDFTTGVDWATLHGKLFIATKSNANRLHVIGVNGTTIRRTGLTGPTTAPVVTNGGSAGSFIGQRQYRVRWTVQQAGVTILRSEPSPVTVFNPSGTANAAVVSNSVPSGTEGDTHWEVEELAPNGSWYRIATVLRSVVTYVDTLALSAVATTGVLSEDVGDYTLQYSARWLTVDEDRLILGGSFDEESKSARVSWTPIGAGGGQGSIGVGNDERLPSDVDGFLDFDTLDGGGLTGLKAWEGKVIVFKRGQVHQMVRSSSRLRAYLPDTLSRRYGALPNSIVEGSDINGLSCLYFLDRDVGPMQLGANGLRVLCPQMQRTWRQNVNLNATVAANVTFHAEKRQVWWHVTFAPNTSPNLRWMYTVETDGLVFQTTPREIKSATYFTGKPTMLYDINGTTWQVQIGQGDQPDKVVDYDNTHRYRAYVTTKAYQLGQLLRRFQIDAAILEVNALIGAVVHIKCVRDFGVEQRSVPVLTTPPGPLVPLIAIPVDNSYMTEAISMQFEIGDIQPLSALDVGGWNVHGMTLAWSLGSPTTGRG